MTVLNAIAIALLLRPEEAGKLLGFSRSKVYGMLAAGELPSIRAGKSIRIPRAALEAWIAANTISGDVSRSAQTNKEAGCSRPLQGQNHHG